jgi:hypothetical protein
MLATRGAVRRDALLLAPLLQEASLIAPIAELVARSDEPAAAAEALARIDGAPTVVAFATLAADPSLSRSRARILSAAFGQWLRARRRARRARRARRRRAARGRARFRAPGRLHARDARVGRRRRAPR